MSGVNSKINPMRVIAFALAAIGYNRLAFHEARKAAQATGKPLLNAGCKKSYTRMSDVNLDIVDRDVPRFVQGDVQDLSMFGDKQFGAAYAAHLLEHVDDPDAAVMELQRVAEHVFIITPLPIYPWSWLHPEHKWVMWGSRKICHIPRFLNVNGKCNGESQRQD